MPFIHRNRLTVAIHVTLGVALAAILAAIAAPPAQATDDAIIVGGPGAVTIEVEDEIGALGLVTQRVEGADRYATAVEASMRLFPTSADVVVLASGVAFADGMAGVPLAASLDASLLLTSPDRLPDVTRTEIERLDPDRVVILGGEAAVSPAVEAVVDTLVPTVERIAGATRTETAAAIAEELGGSGGPAYVVRSDVFADALSIGPAAADRSGPILFTGTGALPAATRAELQRRRSDTIVIVGGMAAVSVEVEEDLDTLAPSVERLAGTDRSATSVVVARAAFGDRPDRALIATGQRFPDAFAAGLLGAEPPPAPILLVGATLSPEVRAYLTGAAANGVPDAVDDAYATDEDTVLDEPAPGVLGNDTDPDGDVLTVLSHDSTSTEGAAVTVNADGSFTYDPTGAPALQALAPGTQVTDTFTYTVQDPLGDQDTATVSIEVTGLPESAAPVILEGDVLALAMDEDDPPLVQPLNAVDANGDALAWQVTGDPSFGSALVDPTSGTSTALTFTPGADANGVVTIEVTVSDGSLTDTIDVEVTVAPVNDDPTVGTPGPYASIGNVGIDVPEGADDLLVGSADDVDGSVGLPLVTTAGTSPTGQGGTVVIATDGSFAYSPAPGFTGPDTFSFEVCDQEGGCSPGSATVQVSDLVWFVDNAATSTPGDGTLGEPFASIAAFNGETGGDVHLATGNADYTTGIRLADGQSLAGDGATGGDLATVLGITVPPHSRSLPTLGGTRPTIAATTASGIALATDTAALGVDVASTGSADGVTGSSLGVTRIAGVDVTTTTGVVVDLAGATAGSDVDFGTLSATSRGGPGIRLSNMTGTVTLATVTLPNPSNTPGNAVEVLGSAADVTIGSATIDATVVGTATTYDASRGLPTNDGSGDGVFLKDNTGSFTLSGGTITNFADNGVDIRNSRDITLSGVTIDGNLAGNSGVFAHVADNLTLDGSTIREIDDNNAAPLVTDSGMRLTDVEGTLNIANSTIAISEGYVERNGTTGSAQRAVELSNRDGCTRDGDDDCTLDVVVTGSTFEDWDFQGLSLRHVGGSLDVDVDGTTGDGANTFRRINGAAVVTGPSRASAAHTHTTRVVGSTFDRLGVAVEAFGTRGGDDTATVTDNTVTDTHGDAIRLVGFNQPGGGPTGTYRGTVTDNVITGVAGHATPGGTPISGGGAGVFIAAEDGSVVRTLVDDNTISGHTGSGGSNSAEALRTQNQRNGRLDVTFTDNTTSDFPTNFFGAVYLGNDNDSNAGNGVTTTCADLRDNSYTNAAGTFANTHAFDTTGSSVMLLPGYTGSSDADLNTYLDAREVGDVTPLTFGNQPTSGDCVTP